ARQIPRVLEHEDEEKQDQYLWQEHEDTASTCNDAVSEKAAQRAGMEDCREPSPDASNGIFDGVHRHDCPTEHGLEHQEKHRREYERADDRTEYDRVESREKRQPRWYAVTHRIENSPYLALGRFHIGVA